MPVASVRASPIAEGGTFDSSPAAVPRQVWIVELRTNKIQFHRRALTTPAATWPGRRNRKVSVENRFKKENSDQVLGTILENRHRCVLRERNETH